MNGKFPPSSSPEGPKLISAAVIIRHGARTPKQPFNGRTHWPFDLSPGQLTSSGWQQSFLMGELLRSHYAPYPIDLKINSASRTLKEIISLQTTSAARCIETAKAILSAFLNKNYPLHHKIPSPNFPLNVCQRHSSSANYDDRNESSSLNSIKSLPTKSFEQTQITNYNVSDLPNCVSSTHLVDTTSLPFFNKKKSKSEQVFSQNQNQETTPIELVKPSSSQDHITTCLKLMDHIDVKYKSDQDITKQAKSIRVKQLKKESLENSVDYKRLNDKNVELIEQIQSLTGWNSAEGLKVVKKFESASGSFQHHSKKLPEEITDDMLKRINKASATLKRLKYSNPEVGWLSGGSMLIEILQQFTTIAQQHQSLQSINRCNKIPKENIENHFYDCESSHLKVHVTHQSALLALQASLGITYKNLYLPNFAGSIFAELIYFEESELEEDQCKEFAVGCQCFQEVLSQNSELISQDIDISTNSTAPSITTPQSREIYKISNELSSSAETSKKVTKTIPLIPPSINTSPVISSLINRKNNSMDSISNRSKTDSIDLSSEWSSNESYDFTLDNTPLIPFPLTHSSSTCTAINQNSNTSSLSKTHKDLQSQVITVFDSQVSKDIIGNNPENDHNNDSQPPIIHTSLLDSIPLEQDNTKEMIQHNVIWNTSDTSSNKTIEKERPQALDSSVSQNLKYYIRWTINGHTPLHIPLINLPSHSTNSLQESNTTCPTTESSQPSNFQPSRYETCNFTDTNFTNFYQSHLTTTFNSESSTNFDSKSPFNATLPTTIHSKSPTTLNSKSSTTFGSNSPNKSSSSPSCMSSKKQKYKSASYRQNIIELNQLKRYVEEMTTKYGSPLC